MVTESSGSKDGVQVGAVAGWVIPCPFRAEFKAKQSAPVTYLLINQQLNAELSQTHVQMVLRLENMQAVQKESRWRMDFDPSRQTLTIHWIKTRRGEADFDHTDLSKARIGRQEGDGSLLQERLTVALLLEDVRPGDILDWCYTIENRPVLLPEYYSAFFALPAGAAVGKFFWAVHFNSARSMQWKSSEKDWIPSKSREDKETLWRWTQENYPGLRAEENTPSWHVPFPWIQVSDCPDWETVAAAFAEAWTENEDDEGIAEIAAEISAAHGNIHQQTDRAIQLVQDEFRQVAMSGELDGRAPAPPGVVARRRFGDGKDLSFFLMHLLKRLGAPARLVLVNSVLRKSLSQLLPTPGLFNHLLVEYQARGETHWVDATLKRQEAGADAGDYGVGLPVTLLSSSLAETPERSMRAGVYELHESILLDTTGAPSWLGVVVSASGRHAEALRHEFESDGLEAVARKRLRLCADRFVSAQRMGALEFRDDRAANEFFLAEIFEINDFLASDAKSGWYKLDNSNDFLANFLKLPEASARRTPFALPYPSTVVHILEVHSVALPPAVVQQRAIETRYLQFSRLRKTLAGFWTVKLSLRTLAGAVEPEDISEHREAVREIRAQATCSILVPAGESRPHQRSDFGKLPTSWDSSVIFPTPASRSSRREQPAALARPETDAPKSPRLKRRKRQRRKREKKKGLIWKGLAGVAVLVAMAFLLLYLARRAGAWFPPPPEPPTEQMP